MGLSCSYKGKSHTWFRTLTTIYMCLMLIELIAQIWSYKVILAGQICSLIVFETMLNDDLNILLALRQIISYQAIRSRYLQIVILIARLEVQLEESKWQRIHNDDYQRSRSSYAHTVYLMQCLSQLYGPSVLLMNILCLGDCIVVCNVYIIVSNWGQSKFTWLLLLKSACAMLTTLLKISIVCLACHRCTAKSKLLRQQLNTRRCRTNFERSLIDDYILHIMQNPIQFDVFGIYQLNLMALTGMFLFMLEALVIFLQFVSLTNISK
ncbi:putative gustatory receptor 9a [Drosophila tropicalis]|uniref:putative gustatory receptor 9a n=1 Tax=Drosophila tropicalis TaxID=46794 RepID=UPI0035ABECF5